VTPLLSRTQLRVDPIDDAALSVNKALEVERILHTRHLAFVRASLQLRRLHEVAPSGRRGERVHGAHPVDCRPDFSPARSDGVALAVREVIARVDVPDGAGARMAGVENTVDDGGRVG